jgi:hypothetical protein
MGIRRRHRVGIAMNTATEFAPLKVPVIDLRTHEDPKKQEEPPESGTENN